MASEYAHCYGGDASREYLSVEDATSNGGDASREYFSVEDASPPLEVAFCAWALCLGKCR